MFVKADISEHTLKELRAAHNEVVKHGEELEQLNTSWAQKNVALHDQVTALKVSFSVRSVLLLEEL